MIELEVRVTSRKAKVGISTPLNSFAAFDRKFVRKVRVSMQTKKEKECLSKAMRERVGNYLRSE